MNIQCCICHEDVRVPVRIICFPCKSEPGHASCNSITRVCLMCAREYLQLNKKRSLRTFSRKCLTCPVMVRCSNLSAFNSYEKDFFLMSHDPRTDYSCFYENEGCEFKGSQNDLDHHIQTECPFRIVSCKYCNTYYPAHDEPIHLPQCAEHFCCFCCLVHIPIHQEKEHFLQEHQQKKCQYCDRYKHVQSYDQHLCECPQRPHSCMYCNEMVPRRHFYDHLVEHVFSCEKNIQNYNNAISLLLIQLSGLLKECQKYK